MAATLKARVVAPRALVAMLVVPLEQAPKGTVVRAKSAGQVKFYPCHLSDICLTFTFIDHRRCATGAYDGSVPPYGGAQQRQPYGYGQASHSVAGYGGAYGMYALRFVV
jgi:hypothetical protein